MVNEGPKGKQKPGQETELQIGEQGGKAKAYNTCRAPQAATATSEALVMSQAKLA